MPELRRPRVALDVSAIPDRPAGAGVYALRLVEALAAGGDTDLVLVAARGDDERWRRIAPMAEVRAVAPRRRPVRLAWEQLRAPAWSVRLGADLWHGPHYTMPLRSPLPTLVTIHDLTFFDHPEWHERAKVLWFRRMIRASASRARLLVCVSHHTARRLVETLGTTAPVEVITHGVDHSRFTPEAEVADDLTLLAGVGVHPPFVAFAGTLEPRKNVPGLVGAFDKVRSAHPGVQLVLAGRSAWGARDVDDALAASSVGALRLGYVANEVVPALFRRAAAVAYPSFEEGFGLPALEALACGAALVTTAGSAMAEVVEDAALLVPPGDDDALAVALEALLAGGPEVDRLRRRGPEVAAAYTWARCAAEHVSCYRRAAGTER